MIPDEPKTKTAGLKVFSPAVKVLNGSVIARTHQTEVWRPTGIVLQRLIHVSTRHGSATRTRIATTVLHP